MILDILQQLAEGGFALRDYKYTGLGSIYFVDFMLLHRLLGLRKLLSVEIAASAERRVRFNKPFGDVDIQIGAIGDVLPSLDRDLHHLVWLDYDHRLAPSDLQDIVLAAQVLSVGSVLLITIDVEPPEDGQTPAEWRRYYETIAGDFLPFDVIMDHFSRSSLGHTAARIITNAIRQGIVGRPSLQYFQLFSFLYADWHQMLTVGGMFGGEAEARRLEGSRLPQCPFVRQDPEGPPFEIKVPKLTRKERIYLDQNMPCGDEWVPTDFDISADELAQYRAIYRHYPLYGELLI
jgi:hypothetical protein